MIWASRAEAEEEVAGRTYLRRDVKPGDTIRLGGGWVATISAQGIACDCGKGVLCPYNQQERR